jgi:hypothetical protein
MWLVIVVCAWVVWSVICYAVVSFFEKSPFGENALRKAIAALVWSTAVPLVLLALISMALQILEKLLG